MIIRKPTTITLKPEDDYSEYEEFKKRQEESKKNVQKKELFNWQQPLQSSKPTRRSIQTLQQEPMEFTNETIWDGINIQIPVNQLYRMINPNPDQMQNESG